MIDLIDKEALKAAYKAEHKGEPGGAWKIICEAPTVEAPQWISVKERLPILNEKSEYASQGCIVCTGCVKPFVTYMEYVKTLVRKKAVYRWMWKDRIAPWEVEHWMPLPNTPKEEKEK